MDQEDLNALIFHGREERNLEYKASMDWNDSKTKAKVAKTAMAMANITDGGTIIFGVEKSGTHYTPSGMTTDHAASFDQDNVSVEVNKYADPFVEVTVSRVNTNDGRVFVAIQVQEFAEIPVVCKRDGPENITEGTIYTRPKRKHESRGVNSQTEMREILDLAVQKGLRRFITQLKQAGIPLGQEPSQTSRDLFEKQLGDL